MFDSFLFFFSFLVVLSIPLSIWISLHQQELTFGFLSISLLVFSFGVNFKNGLSRCMFYVWAFHVFTSINQIEIILALAFLEGLLALFIFFWALLGKSTSRLRVVLVKLWFELWLFPRVVPA